MTVAMPSHVNQLLFLRVKLVIDVRESLPTQRLIHLTDESFHVFCCIILRASDSPIGRQGQPKDPSIVWLVCLTLGVGDGEEIDRRYPYLSFAQTDVRSSSLREPSVWRDIPDTKSVQAFASTSSVRPISRADDSLLVLCMTDVLDGQQGEDTIAESRNHVSIFAMLPFPWRTALPPAYLAAIDALPRVLTMPFEPVRGLVARPLRPVLALLRVVMSLEKASSTAT
ncbi:hypothetical protein KCU65_g203, partial [Aureobasidium melanogenum]